MKGLTSAMLLGVAALCGIGCTHSVHNLYFSGYTGAVPASQGTPITVEKTQFVILGLTGNTDYVDEAYQALQAACPNGAIEGISTRFSTSHSFLSYTNKLHITAKCL